MAGNRSGSGSMSSSSSTQNDSTVFASALVEQVNKDDINSMVSIQREMLCRFEKTNEMLINFNILSTGRYEATAKEFSKHTKLLFEMKRDLDGIFKRIRTLKQRLGTSYPEAFAACNSVYDVPSEEEDSDDDDYVGEGAGGTDVGKETLQVPKNECNTNSSKNESHRKEDHKSIAENS